MYYECTSINSTFIIVIGVNLQRNSNRRGRGKKLVENNGVFWYFRFTSSLV